MITTLALDAIRLSCWRPFQSCNQIGGTGTDIDGASVPPSTWKIFPVTHALAGDAR